MINFTSCNRKYFSVLFLITAFLFSEVKAQTNDELRKVEAKVRSHPAVSSVVVDAMRLTPSLIKLKGAVPVSFADMLLQSTLDMRAIDELRPLKSIETKGYNHGEKRQQYFRGIKVQFGQYNLVMSGEYLIAVAGEFYKIPATLSVNASITESQALQSAKAFIGATEYAWEQVDKLRRTETDPGKLQVLNKYFNDFYPVAEMVIVRNFFDPATKDLDLAFKFNIYAADPISRGYVYVNAHTGKIMFYDKIIKHVGPDLKKTVQAPTIIPEVQYVKSMTPIAASGSNSKTISFFSVNSILTALPTRYAGTRMAGTQLISGNDPNSGLPLTSSHPTTETYVPGSPTHVLIDDTRGGGFETYDLNGIGGLPISVPVYPQGRSFTDVDNVWTLAEHNRGGNNEAENDDLAFDAHWGAGVVYDYWNKVHGRKSFDNQDGTIQSFVHSGLAYDNAFWNGSVMTYGDGGFQGGVAPGFRPLTSLDVCAHEIGHGVCSFTSDLAYQKESGAMNEGFSDIWAACLENYALDSIDATLISGTGAGQSINGYKVFSIGEQIDANDATGLPFTDVPSSNPASTALRYMDNPTAAGDPASYWGTNFDDPNCTPTLANDQCGVHTNSGVLNHWFYYLVMGSGGPGNVQTNNTNNTTGALNGESFEVTGIGFRKAERMTYLMEQLLTSNATFLEARNMTIIAAEALYGKCSFEYKQAIVAWHAVAVGSSADTALCSTLPLFSVAVQDSLSEATAKSATTCNENKKIISLGISVLPPGFANGLTVTITPSGTATPGKDYSIQNTVINYASNETGLRSDTITILNDGEVEPQETIILNINASDGLGFTKDTTVTIIISDDDDVPSISSNRIVLLNENFDNTATGSLPAGWTSIDKLGNNLMAWRVGNGNATTPASSFTTKSVMADLNLTPTVEPLYDPSAPVTIILRTPLIDATSLTDIKLNFNWAALGEPDPGPPVSALDFGKVMYSTDGVNFQPFQFDDREYSLTPLQKRDSINIPPQLSNSKFYIGFVWFNDDNVAAPPSFHLDSIRITAGQRKIETELNDGVAETQYAGKQIFYLSAQDGEVITSISNNSEDLDCVTTKLSEAGSGTHPTAFSYDGFTYLRTKKVISITPSSPHPTATYDLSLYVTTDELGVLNTSQVKIFKVKDGVQLSGNISTADAEIVTPVVTDHSADGYFTFAGSFTGFSQFFIAQATGPVPVTLISFDAFPQNNKFIKLTWKTNNESNIRGYVIEKAVVGSNNFMSVGTVNALNNINGSDYVFNDMNVKPNITYQYRLRIVENSRYNYSQTKLAKISGHGSDISITPNPSPGIIRVEMNGYNGIVNIAVINNLGQVVHSSRETGLANRIVYIDLSKQTKGVYSVRIRNDEEEAVQKIVIQ